MTETEMVLFWVDDDPRRREYAEQLDEKINEGANERKRLSVKFFDLNEWNAFMEKAPSKEDIVDLFLVDYLLFVKRRERAGGLSVAGEIREYFPNVPIYMFSVKAIPDIASRFSDAILELKEIQRHPVKIYYDCADYHRIRHSLRRSVNDVLALLQAPKCEAQRIPLALPENIKLAIFDAKKKPFDPIVFASWTRQTLLKMPGFLYNSLYSATSLGMNEDAFLKLSDKFHDAVYEGVFSRTNTKLWWVSALKDIVFKEAKKGLTDDGTTDLTRLAPKLYCLNHKQLSICGVCGKKYPETVGFSKLTGSMKPVHYRCSIPNPERTRMTYFEEDRLLSESE